MASFKIINSSSTGKTAFTPEKVAAVHKALSAEERKELSYVRVLKNNADEPCLDIKFKNKDARICGTGKTTEITGDFDSKDIDSLIRITSLMGWDKIKIEGNETDKNTAWLCAENIGQVIEDFIPNAASIQKNKEAIEKLLPMTDFALNAEKYTVHQGKNSSKETPAMRFLKATARCPKKIISGAVKKTTRFIRDLYDFNEKPGVKVAAAVGATAVGGGAGLTYYMVADKFHWAYDLMVERRKEEKERQQKVAEFMQKGIEIPKELRKKKFLYPERPWIKMAGHLTVRLGGTALLAAQYGPWSGAAFIGSIVLGKALWNASLIQDTARFLRTGQKPDASLSAEQRASKLTDTLAKSAIFTAAAVFGLHNFDPSAIPGVSIGPTRWGGVDKIRTMMNRLKNMFKPHPENTAGKSGKQIPEAPVLSKIKNSLQSER